MVAARSGLDVSRMVPITLIALDAHAVENAKDVIDASLLVAVEDR